MKPYLDLNKSVVFTVVFVCVAGLIAMGKLPAETLKYLLVWLVPSPLVDAKSIQDQPSGAK